MDLTTRDMLSSALGDIIRGLKKIKTVVDKNLGDKKSPAVTKCNEAGAKVPKNDRSQKKVDVSVSQKPVSQCDKVPDNFPVTFCTRSEIKYNADGLLDIDLIEPSTWLFDPKHHWGSFHSTLNFLFGKTLRGDRFKNQWQKDKTCKRGWRKISDTHLQALFRQANGYQDCCATMVQYCSHRKEDLESDWQVDISDENWERRQTMWESTPTMKCMRSWLINVHSSLPALNLPSLKV